MRVDISFNDCTPCLMSIVVTSFVSILFGLILGRTYQWYIVHDTKKSNPKVSPAEQCIIVDPRESTSPKKELSPAPLKHQPVVPSIVRQFSSPAVEHQVQVIEEHIEVLHEAALKVVDSIVATDCAPDPALEAFRETMGHLFWAFAGSSSWNKKRVYMSREEAMQLIRILQLPMDCDEIFNALDSDVVDGRLTDNEWVEYFCDENVNPKANELRALVKSQPNWRLLITALDVFDNLDKDKSGTVDYSEFRVFGDFMDLNAAETEDLWHKIDVDGSGMVTLKELFDWYSTSLLEKQNHSDSSDEDDVDSDDSLATDSDW